MIPMNKFTTVSIEQIREGDEKYRYSIFLNHVEAFTIVNTKPQEFKDVQVFFGDRYYPASDAMIRNFKFQNLEA